MKSQKKQFPQCMRVISICLYWAFFSNFQPIVAQEAFGDRCIGHWEGIMYLYGKGQLRDSVAVQLEVKKTDSPNKWSWKTSYLSKTMPAVKDYTLILNDPATNAYSTDEGDGVVLKDYLFQNKLYSVFETQGILLTSSYEMMGDQLIFEVTSGKKLEESNKGVSNYSVTSLQRVIFKKNKHP